VVLGRARSSPEEPRAGENLQILLTAEDLAAVSKSHSDFLTLLFGRAREKGVRLGEEEEK
jgi:hypothetical protein